MENASDALKIAFAILIFVTATTIFFMLTGQVKRTADSVFFSIDETNYYEHADSAATNRVVSYSEVVSTLYRYYKESLCVTIDLTGVGGEEKVFDLKDSKANIEEIETELANYILDVLINYEDNTFNENFVEVPISGIYEKGEDGTEIVKSSGGKKVYITYTAK